MVANDCVSPQKEAAESIELTAEEKKMRLTSVFAEGKRDYLAEEYEKAVEKLGEAAALAEEVYGQKAAECFEPNLYYGKALLGVCRREDDVLQNAMKDMPLPEEEEEGVQDDSICEDPSSLTEEEREEIRDKVDEALEENAVGVNSEQKNEPQPEGDAEKKNEVDEEDNTSANEGAGTEEREGGDNVSEQGNDDDAEEGEGETGQSGDVEVNEHEESQDEEPTSIQLAWEVFEVCRLICEAQEENAEWDMKKAEALLHLGECSIEDESYEQAVEDFKTCLAIKEKHNCTGRFLADVYFELARAHKLNDDFDSAAQYYSKALESINAKIALMESEENKDEGELSALKEIASDLHLKIEDAKMSAQQVKEAKTAQENEKSAIPPVPTDGKPAALIEVRKAVKRQAPGDSSEDTENIDAKKAKADSVAMMAKESTVDSTLTASTAPA